MASAGDPRPHWRTRIDVRNLAWEVFLIGAVLFVYQVGRFLVRPDPAVAHDNALAVIDAERATGTYFEPAFQAWVLGHDWLVGALNDYYSYLHFTPAMAFLAWVYFRREDAYKMVRTMILAATVLGFFVHWAYPTAPPRLTPESGMVDTLTA